MLTKILIKSGCFDSRPSTGLADAFSNFRTFWTFQVTSTALCALRTWITACRVAGGCAVAAPVLLPKVNRWQKWKSKDVMQSFFPHTHCHEELLWTKQAKLQSKKKEKNLTRGHLLQGRGAKKQNPFVHCGSWPGGKTIKGPWLQLRRT